MQDLAAFDHTTNNFAFRDPQGPFQFGIPPPAGQVRAACHVTTATIMVNNAANGASYLRPLRIAKNPTTGVTAYYAANANGGVRLYDRDVQSDRPACGRLHRSRGAGDLYAGRYSSFRLGNRCVV